MNTFIQKHSGAVLAQSDQGVVGDEEPETSQRAAQISDASTARPHPAQRNTHTSAPVGDGAGVTGGQG